MKDFTAETKSYYTILEKEEKVAYAAASAIFSAAEAGLTESEMLRFRLAFEDDLWCFFSDIAVERAEEQCAPSDPPEDL